MCDEDELYNAIRVDHNHARIPKPTKELLLELATGIHLAVAGMASISRKEDESSYPEWSALSEETQEFWLEGAKCAYSIIAIHGGGEVVKINKPDA